MSRRPCYIRRLLRHMPRGILGSCGLNLVPKLRRNPMGVTAEKSADAVAIRPFQIEVPEEQLAELRRRIEATRWPSKELVDDRSQGVQLATTAGARPLLDDRVRLARVRGATERAAAVHDRDRRRGHPLHPRAVAARGRAAADHDARLARLGRRAARDRRPAHRPDRARRRRRGRVPPGAAVAARLRLLGRAERSSAGTRAASEPPGRS